MRRLTARLGPSLTRLVIILAAYGVVPRTDAAEPAPLAPMAKPQALAIHVLSATYGSERWYDTCPATEYVKHACEGRLSCTVEAMDRDCAATAKQPGMLIPKLTVQYRCFSAEKPRLLRVEKPFRKELHCSLLH